MILIFLNNLLNISKIFQKVLLVVNHSMLLSKLVIVCLINIVIIIIESQTLGPKVSVLPMSQCWHPVLMFCISPKVEPAVSWILSNRAITVNVLEIPQNSKKKFQLRVCKTKNKKKSRMQGLFHIKSMLTDVGSR